MHVVYFSSIDNFNQKGIRKMIFELMIKAKVSAKCIYDCTRSVFSFLPCINFAELYFAFYSWHITIFWHITCIRHEYVNICSNSWYLQQYNLTCVELSMGLTPCWKHHASVYSIDSTSLRFNGQVTKSVVFVLLMTKN